MVMIKGYKGGSRLSRPEINRREASSCFSLSFHVPSVVISGGLFKIIMRKWIYLLLCVLSTAAACHFLVLMVSDNMSFTAGIACVFFATLAVVFSHEYITHETIQTKHRK